MPTIHEYETTTLDLTRSQAEALLRTEVVDVRPAADGRWNVTAGSKVGSVVMEGVELLIRPKIRPENLFLLLEPGLPSTAWREESFAYDVSSDLLPAVLGVFARAVEVALARGLLRSYEHRNEALVAMRGRLDTAGQFTRAGILTPVACSFDEFTEDVLENRALRAALRAALRVPRVRPDTRRRLMQQLVALDGVSDARVRPEQIDSVHYTRLNEHYAPSLRLASLILENLTLVDARGGTSASTFTVDMNQLFQRFVTERLRDELRGHLRVETEPAVYLGRGRRVHMSPDLVFRSLGGRSQPCHVGDVKYKVARDAAGRSSDYYQLLAYTTALALPVGLLIYCRLPGDEIQKAVTVRHAGTTLYVRAIDLSGTADGVHHEVRELARIIRETTARPGDVRDRERSLPMGAALD